MKIASFTVAGAALLASGTAHADNRSSGAITAKKTATEQPGNPQGPKNGFKDNYGRERASEVANDNARFLRNDSQG